MDPAELCAGDVRPQSARLQLRSRVPLQEAADDRLVGRGAGKRQDPDGCAPSEPPVSEAERIADPHGCRRQIVGSTTSDADVHADLGTADRTPFISQPCLDPHWPPARPVAREEHAEHPSLLDLPQRHSPRDVDRPRAGEDANQRPDRGKREAAPGGEERKRRQPHSRHDQSDGEQNERRRPSHVDGTWRSASSTTA